MDLSDSKSYTLITGTGIRPRSEGGHGTGGGPGVRHQTVSDACGFLCTGLTCSMVWEIGNGNSHTQTFVFIPPAILPLSPCDLRVSEATSSGPCLGRGLTLPSEVENIGKEIGR